jgi:TPR repeat protein
MYLYLIAKISLIFFCVAIVMSTGCSKNNSRNVSQMTIVELQTAAEQGNDQAMVWLGLDYDLGRGGTTQNFNEAVKWFRKAANDQDPEA